MTERVSIVEKLAEENIVEVFGNEEHAIVVADLILMKAVKKTSAVKKEYAYSKFPSYEWQRVRQPKLANHSSQVPFSLKFPSRFSLPILLHIPCQ